MILKDSINHFFYSLTVNELQLMNEKFKTLNITYNSLLYLDIISYTPKCTVTYLAQALCISKSAVTLKINEMVKLGLIEKRQSEIDKRVFYLELSKDVEEIYLQYDKALLSAIEHVNQKYSEEEKDIFSRILNDIAKSYVGGIQNG